jgi:hypothetical protein
MAHPWRKTAPSGSPGDAFAVDQHPLFNRLKVSTIGLQCMQLQNSTNSEESR